MTGFDYPPSTTYRLDEALEQARHDEDVDDTTVDALQWAVEQFGADAEITLQAFTTRRRDRTLDTANRKTMGPLGGSAVRTWLIASSITAAPWLEGEEDLAETHAITAELPPSVVDWLDSQLEELNDLSEGN